MHSKMIDLSDMANPPSVKLMVMKDTVSGWNLHLQTEHFRFAADQSGAAHKAGYGRNRLYARHRIDQRQNGNALFADADSNRIPCLSSPSI